MQQVGDIRVDFEVFSRSPKGLVVADESDWLYSKSLPSYVCITLPGSKKIKTFPFKKDALNRFDSNILGLSCLTETCKEQVLVDLPDGIYTITVKSGYKGIEKTSYYLKTDLFKQYFAKTVINNGLDYNNDNKLFLEGLNFIEGLMSLAKVYAYEGDFIKSKRFFEQSNNELSKLVNCV